jgi:deoxyribose-phosphate aldolase
VTQVEVATLGAAIDQTLLRPTAGFAETDTWCAANADKGFAALCVAPASVPVAVKHVGDGPTRVCAVVGFPLGYATTGTKTAEAAQLVIAGAREIDMVIHVGALLEGDSEYVRADIAAVVDAVRQASVGSGLVKVILETGFLGEADIVAGCAAAQEAGADFVKTSTGFGPRGATVEDVRIMRSAVGESMGVKAAGGIRDLAAALAMLEAGADRIGTSAGAEILDAFSKSTAGQA